LDFQGACSITLERCDWQGDYDPATKRTALNSNGQALTVTDCQFSTRSARAISVKNNRLTLTGSRFTRCGHAELNGGAVWHSDHERIFNDCCFDCCLASYGGALWVNDLHGVNQCEFVSCESLALQDKQAGDIAVYAVRNSVSPVMNGCVFRHTSVNVGNSYDGSRRQIAVDCQFVKGNLYFYKTDSHVFDLRSTFDGGSVIEKLF
jgi:hypothetical protein